MPLTFSKENNRKNKNLNAPPPPPKIFISKKPVWVPCYIRMLSINLAFQFLSCYNGAMFFYQKFFCLFAKISLEK